MSNADQKLPDHVDITPHWAGLFRFGEQLIKDADFDGKAFVLEMYQFGARCYDAIKDGD